MGWEFTSISSARNKESQPKTRTLQKNKALISILPLKTDKNIRRNICFSLHQLRSLVLAILCKSFSRAPTASKLTNAWRAAAFKMAQVNGVSCRLRQWHPSFNIFSLLAQTSNVDRLCKHSLRIANLHHFLGSIRYTPNLIWPPHPRSGRNSSLANQPRTRAASRIHRIR